MQARESLVEDLVLGYRSGWSGAGTSFFNPEEDKVAWLLAILSKKCVKVRSPVLSEEQAYLSRRRA
jgi:hypothetical protein